MNLLAERSIARYLGIGSAFTAVFLMTGLVTDPVNSTKLASAGAFAFAAFAVVLAYKRREMLHHNRVYFAIFILLFVSMLNAVISSELPMAQNLYGVYGRQTGLVFYVVMMFIALSASTLREEDSFKWLLFGLIGAGAVNLVYAGWAELFGDFVGWNNPYGNILGTFGNPNFIGSFLGIFLSVVLAYFVSGSGGWKVYLLLALTFLVGFWLIDSSNAIQGKVVFAAGASVVGLFWVHLKIKNLGMTSAYIVSVFVVGGFALAGALQKGPLAQYIYKNSVSLRGQYWQAGIETGSANPLTGVGMDGYGDWFRRSRTVYAATENPGPNTVTNAAHNVFIDFFAYGGWPLLLSYVGVTIVGLWIILRNAIKLEKYDPLFVSLSVGWICYQLQSFISINQVGLAIWGWLFLGALIAYEARLKLAKELANSEPLSKMNRKNKRSSKPSLFSPTLIGGLGLLLGIFVASPPLTADMKWKSATSSLSVAEVEKALSPSYFNPSNSVRLAQAVQLLEQSKLTDLAHKYALKGVEFNSNNYDAWRILFLISKSSTEEKALAVKKMHELDPFNPSVTAP